VYLVVFVTLVIAVLGTYTQVLAVEAARIASQQTSTAQAMLAWHTASISMATSVIQDSNYVTSYASAGCSLSIDHTTTIATCPPPVHVGLPTQTNGTVTNSLAGVTTSSFNTNMYFNHITNVRDCVHLPNTRFNGSACITTFDAKHYEFYSLLFRDSSTGVDYVVTYAAPATAGSAGSSLVLASGTQISLTGSDLFTQLRNMHVSSLSYGTFDGTKISGAAYAHYPAGISSIIPTGAVAVITGGF